MDKLGYTFYPKDFISDPDVMMMTPSQRGVYRDLIDLAYMNDNKIKYNLIQLSKYCNATEEEINEVLSLKGEKIDNFWTIPSCNKRIAKSKVNRANGSKGGRPKKTKENPIETQNETQTKPNLKGKEKEKENIKENKEEQTPPTPKGEFFNFDVYLDKINELFGKNLRVVNKKAKQSINARLKEGYTKSNIWNAMINCKNDSWHKENNYQYCTPQYFSQVKTLDMYGSEINNKDPRMIGSKTEYYQHD
jgi:uncharacterized phage protein (TIGR02220 family)